MKESEFIELLNLYLDHEISAADATRLEAEVQGSAERRKVYQEYCRMQKACRVLASDFQADAPAGSAAAAANVLKFSPDLTAGSSARQTAKIGYYAVGTFAAIAACATVVFFNRSQPAPVGASVVQSATVSNNAGTSIAAMPPIKRGGLTAAASAATPVSLTGATMVSNPLLLTGNSRGEGILTLSTPANDEQLAWIGSLQLAPVQRVRLDDLRFGSSPTSLRPEGRQLGGSRTPAEGPTEMSAFRFEK